MNATSTAATVFLTAAIACLPFVGACDDGGEDQQVLVVFHAGSLTAPFDKVEAAFEREHPNVDVRCEPAGSRDCARKITDQNRLCDVMGSADYSVVNQLLRPDHASFNIHFATNEMAIAYGDHSRRGDEITRENWPDILLDADVAFGRANPDRDPCGYRSIMVMQLAEKHFNRPGLAKQLRGKDGDKYIRPKETDLLALLEAGEIDYLFIYRSVAEQHGMKMLPLPDEVNLRAAELADLYAEAKVEVSGKNPGETITKTGTPMVYSVTIPRNSPNPDLAAQFIAFLLSEKGRAIMAKCGQPTLTPAVAEGYDQLPESLRPLCKKP